MLFYRTGVCIFRPPALCLAPSPGPEFVFTNPGPIFVFTGPGPEFVCTGPGPEFVFNGPGPNLYLPTLVPAMTPDLYLQAQVKILLLPQLLVLSLLLLLTPLLLLLLLLLIYNNNKRCNHGSKIHIKWPVKDI